jgi:regulator of sigma E protease
MAIEVLRDGEAVRVSAVPRVETPAGEGALGILLSEGGTPRQGFFVALYRGLIEAGAIAWMTLAGLYQIVAQLVTKGSLVAGVVGPVGIFSVAQQTGQLGLVYLLQLLSIISINLAVINLVPFPALDGGRFWMILIEKLKGSPVPRKVEALVNGVGFVLLLLLMAALTVRDVSGLF